MPEEIKLGAEATKRLVNELKRRRDEAREFKSNTWDQTHDDYWRLFRADPKDKVKNFPWPNASNLFVPLAQAVINGVRSQIYDAMVSNEPLVEVKSFTGFGPQRQQSEQLSEYYGEFLYSKVIPFRKIFNDWLLDACVDGSGCVKVRWDRSFQVSRKEEQRLRLKMKTLRAPTIFGKTMETKIPSGIEVKMVEVPTISRLEQPVIEVVDLSYIYMAPDSGPSLNWPECRWYYQEQRLTKEDLFERKHLDYHDIDKVLDSNDFAEKELTEREETQRDREGLQRNTEETTEVCEFYMRWPLPTRYQKIDEGKKESIDQDDDEEGHMEEIIVTFHPGTSTILRIVPLQRLYPDGKRPHVMMHYDRIPRSPFGIGVAAALMHINEAQNTLYNQWIDFGSLLNLPYFFYNPAATGGALPDLLGIRPGQGIPTLDPRGVVTSQLKGDSSFWLNGLQYLQQQGERVGNVSDFTLGRAPSTPNAPRTARGTMAIMQQGQLAFSRIVAMMAEAPLEVFRRIHSLHGKWAASETEFAVLKEGQLTNRFLPREAFNQDVEFQFVLNPNRMADQQQALMLFQTLMPLLAQINPMAVRALTKDVLHAHGKKNIDELWPMEPPPDQQGGQQGQEQLPVTFAKPQAPEVGVTNETD
jgi:hypothetical protein